MRTQYVFAPSCPEELFTDREEELERLYRMGVNAALRRTYGTALIGLRRLGKTELFKRVVGLHSIVAIMSPPPGVVAAL